MTDSRPAEPVSPEAAQPTGSTGGTGAPSRSDDGVSPPPSSPTREPQPETVRLVFIDGLRGLAALAVTLYHFAGHRECQSLTTGALAPLFDVVAAGYLGVAVFYTLTGFVIAQSWGLRTFTWPAYGRFVARRLLRLTPPYWATLALVVATTEAANLILPDYHQPLPTLGSIVAHAVYVYPLFGYPALLEIFWTLVHIAQFYLAFPWLAAAEQQVARWWRRRRKEQPAATPLLPAAVLVVVVLPAWASAWLAPRVEGIPLDTWYLFCLGVMTGWLLRRWVDRWVAAVFAAGIAASVAVTGSLFAVASLATCGLIVLAQRLNRLDRWLAGPGVQFLGRISYSLYLLHGTVGWRFLSVGERLTGSGPLSAALWLAVAVATSIIAAYVLYRLVEEPCQRMSRRLALDGSRNDAPVERGRSAAPG